MSVVADQPSALSGAFRRPFAEQVAFFRQKMGNLVPTARWGDMTGAAHDTGFMVAGAQKAELLADLASSIDRAITEGKSLEAFRKDFGAAVERHDWHGWTGEDTKGGRAWRTRTIYRTNTYVSYAAGRRAQLETANWPLWVYLHGGSKDPRPEHLHVFNGLVLPPDHPFWEKHYPPSDWGCSCYVVGARSARGARRLGGNPDKTLPDGWDAIDPATGEPAGIGKGWGYAPGASVVHAIAAKVREWAPQIGRDFIASLPTAVRSEVKAAMVPDAPPPIRSVEDLTEDEREAFVTYTRTSGPINEPLRDEGRLTSVGEVIADVLDRAEHPVSETVYRGVHGVAAELLRGSDLEAGDIIHDMAFASLSRNRAKAGQFQGDDDGVLMIVSLPEGSKALYIQSLSRYRDEEEILLQHGAAMKVVRWDEEAGILEVEVQSDG